MNARMIFLALICAVASAEPAGWAAGMPDPESPVAARNILFIVGDDSSAQVLECYGNPLVRTPNLDRLASGGTRFGRAYCNSPVCTPSRQSMITGKLPHAVGVTLLQTALAEDQLTIAEHLKQFGFKTGAVGKMHFNSQLKHGFDYRFDSPEYNTYVREHPPRVPPADMRVKPRWRPFQDPARIWLNADMLPTKCYDADSEGTWFAGKAIEFLRENSGNRFCLWLGFLEPHSPFDFPIEYAGRYDPAKMPVTSAGPEDGRWVPAVFRDLTDADKRGIIASYYTSAEYLDKNIGLVLDELQKLGLSENTLVIFVGDNGYLLGEHGRFEKHTMWEPAVRVPLILRDPQFARGKAADALVEFVDLLPSILERLQVPLMPNIQGKSLVPLLQGKSRKHRDYVFSEYLPDNMAMVRTAEWKYVFISGKKDLALGYETGNPPPGITHMLYDLKRDPGETHNLAGDPKYFAVLRDLQQKMLARFKETHPKAGSLPQGLSVEQSLAWFCEPPDPQAVR
jgi:arylsulfatase A-like enzyme